MWIAEIIALARYNWCMNPPRVAKRIGPRTQKWLRSRKFGALGTEMIEHAGENARQAGSTVADSFMRERGETWERRLSELYTAVKERLSFLPNKLLEEGRAAVAKKLAEMPHLKGDDGYTPQKGKDYFDGEPGAPGSTPVPGVDYATLEQTNRLVDQAMAALYEKIEREGFSAGAAQKMVEAALGELPYAKIARGIEGLTEREKLDYEKGLKNKPTIPDGSSAHKRTLHRGTSAGREAFYYDLSDLCDGVTKSFNIPSNTRVLAVHGTDSPAGTYRPVVDWTGGGTTTLELTDQVIAPTEGATLYILYVA